MINCLFYLIFFIFSTYYRNLKIREGDEECREDDDDECFEAEKRRRINKKSGGGTKTYQMELKAERLSEADVREPMVLVKEYRKVKGRRRNRFKIIRVPRSTRVFDTTGLAPFGTGGVDCGEDVCYINGRSIRVGSSYEDDEDLCVTFECVAPGTIEVDEVRNCDKSK